MLRGVCAVALAAVLMIPAVAWPCGNATYLQGDRAVAQVNKADKLLAAGKPEKALELVDWRYEYEGKLQERADLIAMVARLRVGRITPEDAAEWFEARLKDNPEQPYVVARLAEAYAAMPKKTERARKLLEDLHARDLMPDGEAYATLAALRDGAGDAEGRDDALASCRKVAKRKAVCKLPKSAPVKKAAAKKSAALRK